MKREIPKKYNKLTILEALEAAKHFTALDTPLRRYTREDEAKRIYGMFST